MAFRNSVKATLLSEAQQPRSRSDEPRAIVEEAAPPPSVAPQRPPENAAQRASESAAQNASAGAAKPAPVAKQAATAPPPAKDKAFLAAAWHARAEELCAMADALPSESAWSLISKIAGLYDELARDAGWSESAALVPGDARLEEPQTGTLAPERVAFPRRPLPLGRRFPRRRA